jgi:hypothetical protein
LHPHQKSLFDSLVGLVTDHVTGLLVTGDDVRSAVSALGDSHADLGGGLPDALGVVTETHVVGAGDGLTVVLALLADEGLDGVGEGGGRGTHVEVLTILTLGVSQAALSGDLVGPLLGAGDKRVVPLERRVADFLTGLVVEIDGLLLVGGQRTGAATGAGLLGLELGLFLLGGFLLDGSGSVGLLGLFLPSDVGGLDLDGGGALPVEGRSGLLVAGGNDLGNVLVLGDDLVVRSGHGTSGHDGGDEGRVMHFDGLL